MWDANNFKTPQLCIAKRWLAFAISMWAGLFVVLITISYHTIKAIRVNPADTLKCE